MNQGRWTEDELMILEKMAGNRPLIDIVRAVQKYHRDKGTGIKRSRNAVRVKLKRMNLSLRCTEDYMTAYEWSRQLGIGKWRVSNWVSEGYLKPRKIARNQNAISIKQMVNLATAKPYLFSAVNPDILDYFFGEELTKEILKHKQRCYEYRCRPRFIERTDTGEVVEGVKNLARQLRIDPCVIRRELKKKDSWLVEVNK